MEREGVQSPQGFSPLSSLFSTALKWVRPTFPSPPPPQKRNIIYLGKAYSRASKELDSDQFREEHSILGPAKA